MYVAVKGGELAIAASRALVAAARRGDPALPPLVVAQVQSQMGLAVSRVMAEASLYDPELAALALVQAQGDAVEAAFLLRVRPRPSPSLRPAAARALPLVVAPRSAPSFRRESRALA